MRSAVCWLVWMLLIGLVIAANSPGEWAAELETVSQAPFIFVGAFIALYAVIVIPTIGVISKDTTKTMEAKYEGEIKILKSTLEADKKENERLETKITELEKPTQNQPLYESSPSQKTLEPVSVVKVSEANAETPKILSAGLTDYSPSQTELKIQALKTANEIYRTIEEAKRQARQTTSGLEIGVHFLYKVRPDDLKSLEYKNILDSTLSYYSKDLHNTAVELKLKIFVQNQIRFLPVSNYANPVDLYALEAIANDLRDIASAQNEQV